MNSENSKASEPHVLILTLTDKLDLKRGEMSLNEMKWVKLFYQILVFITHGKT